MKNLNHLTLKEIKEGLSQGKWTSLEVVNSFYEAYQEDLKEEKPLNAFIEFFQDAQEQAKEADELRKKGDTRPFLGVPIAIKDNILIKGKKASVASSALKNFISPYDSTVAYRLKDAGFILLGRANMDEFAMGSSTEYSLYGATRNPLDRDHSAGGSSGGSASVVAGFQAPIALGTDTGGSVRLPSAFTGIYGYKPTYGMISRYGVVGYASSLDQVGILGKTPEDIAEVLEVLRGKDNNDMTSRDYLLSLGLKDNISSLKVAVLKDFETDSLHNSVKEGLGVIKNFLIENNAQIEEISLPIIKDTLALYYVISLCEAASNLSRYDSIRYGERPVGNFSLEELYTAYRSENIGEEVERRVTLGNYFLSADSHGQRFYDRSIDILNQLRDQLRTIFEGYDILLVPTSFAPAFKLGEKNNNPLDMYLNDLGTIFVNLCGLPGISVPYQEEGSLPVGFQFISQMGKDDLILNLAQKWHERRNS